MKEFVDFGDINDGRGGIMRKLLIVAVLIAFVIPTSVLALEQIVPYGYSYFTPPEGVGTVTTVLGFLDPPVGFD